MPTDAQVERLLTKAEPSSKSTTGEYALAHGRARYVIAGKSGSGKSERGLPVVVGPSAPIPGTRSHAARRLARCKGTLRSLGLQDRLAAVLYRDPLRRWENQH